MDPIWLLPWRLDMGLPKYVLNSFGIISYSCKSFWVAVQPNNYKTCHLPPQALWWVVSIGGERGGCRGQPEARDVADFFGGEFRLLCHTFRKREEGDGSFWMEELTNGLRLRLRRGRSFKNWIISSAHRPPSSLGVISGGYRVRFEKQLRHLEWTLSMHGILKIGQILMQ